MFKRQQQRAFEQRVRTDAEWDRIEDLAVQRAVQQAAWSASKAVADARSGKNGTQWPRLTNVDVTVTVGADLESYGQVAPS